VTSAQRFQIALCFIIWAVILIFVLIAAVMPNVVVAIVRPIVRQILQHFWH